MQKIHQSDCTIAGLIFSKYQSGSVRIGLEIELIKIADAEIELCKLSSPDDEGPHIELRLDI